MQTPYSVTTETHLLQIYNWEFFAVFNRSDQGPLSSETTSPIELPEPIFKGRFLELLRVWGAYFSSVRCILCVSRDCASRQALAGSIYYG